MSAYRTAIDATTSTIDRRARYFRNLIVIVVAIGTLVLIGAVAMRSFTAVCAWLILVPACGLFFYVDARVLNRWRESLLAAWVTLDIDFEVLRGALLANPAMPTGTLESMLATLPSVGDVRAEQQVQQPTRRAIAAVSVAIHCDRAGALLLKVLASAIVVGALLAALWLRGWLPLTGLATLALLPPVAAWRRRRRRMRLEADVAEMRGQPGFTDADYRRLEAGLSDVDGHRLVPASERRPG